MEKPGLLRQMSEKFGLMVLQGFTGWPHNPCLLVNFAYAKIPQSASKQSAMKDASANLRGGFFPHSFQHGQDFPLHI